MSMIKKFLANDSGATAIEYALIASLIALAVIGGATALGTRVNTEFNSISAQLK